MEIVQREVPTGSATTRAVGSSGSALAAIHSISVCVRDCDSVRTDADAEALCECNQEDMDRYCHNITTPHTASSVFTTMALSLLGFVQFSFVVAGSGNVGESGKPSNVFSCILSLDEAIGLEVIESAEDTDGLVERVVFRRGRILVEVAQASERVNGAG